MKFGVVNTSRILNRFVLHTLQRNITHLDVITRKTNIKLGILKRGGELEKSRKKLQVGGGDETELEIVAHEIVADWGAGGRGKKKPSPFLDHRVTS